MDDRVAARGLSALAEDGRAGLGHGRLSEDRLPGSVLLRQAEVDAGKAEVAGRSRSEAAGNLRKARYPAEGADDPRGCRRRGERTGRGPQGGRGCGVRLGVRGHDLPEGTGKGGRDLLFDLGGHPRASGAGEEIPRVCGAGVGQLLCDAELGRLLGRVLRLRAAGREMPDGTFDLFPDQCREHRAVRADADHRRQRRLRVLSGRLYRAAAGYLAASRRRRGTGRARRCGDQVFHRPELVPG